MAYQLPTFNVQADIWHAGTPLTGPPDLTPLSNLALGRRIGTDDATSAYAPTPLGTMWLLLPASTDIRDGAAVGGADVVEVPHNSGKLYDVVWVDDIGTGFPNEHRFAVLRKRKPWGVPFGTGAATPPPGSPPSVVTQSWVTNFAGISNQLRLSYSATGSVRLVGMAFIFDEVLQPISWGTPDTAGRTRAIPGGHTITGWVISSLSGPGTNIGLFFGTQSGANRFMAVSLTAYPVIHGGVAWSGDADGTGGGPNISPAPNPAQQAILTAQVAFMTGTIPGGVTVTGGYTVMQGTPNTLLLGGLVWTGQTWQYYTPPSSPPAFNANPFFGWNDWLCLGEEVTQ